MKTLLALLLLSFTQISAAQTTDLRQDPALVRQVAEQFLNTQARGLPGQVSISVSKLDPRLDLTACAAPQAFMPTGSRVWGKTTVGIRCSVPTPWTVYIQARITVVADYLVAAAPLAQGQIVSATDIATMQGDLTTLPTGIITDASQAIGRTVTLSLQAGTALRQDSLRSQPAVQQGQTVRLVSTGPGFRVTAEAQALTSAGDGQLVQARTQNGQMVRGVAKAGGVVEVSY
ncbi:MAG TPA: flagellar basal body P-ring formation protein FlgA [Betaproteobacteria bacterium]|nr:flagellar basal body P-ring formation protein FlgA [Betaproteobacteria bacterium]